MNLLGMLTCWTGGQLFGNSEQFARGGIELSGDTGWFALAPAAQILPRGDRPRHATGQLSHATDDLSRRPDHPSEPPSQSAGLTDELSGRPGGLARRPSQLSRRPDEPDGRPSEPDGPGAARRGGMAARRRGMEAPRRGMHGPRRPGVRALARAGFVPEGRRGAPPRHGWSIARAVFVPEGRRGVATGGAMGRRPERNPWTGAERCISAPAGRRSFAGCASSPVDAPFLCPSGAGENMNDALHGLRSLEDSLTPPVATALDPAGVERQEQARAGDRLFSAGEVPEGRHAPLASADLHVGGSGVRRG
jgi:hypothetical protein